MIVMAQWKVHLYGIEWDDGKGEYDVSELPPNLVVTVEADNKKAAIEYAMREAAEEFGSLVAGTEQIEASTHS
jgi:hypothetical protein